MLGSGFRNVPPIRIRLRIWAVIHLGQKLQYPVPILTEIEAKRSSKVVRNLSKNWSYFQSGTKINIINEVKTLVGLNEIKLLSLGFNFFFGSKIDFLIRFGSKFPVLYRTRKIRIHDTPNHPCFFSSECPGNGVLLRGPVATGVRTAGQSSEPAR